MKLWLAPLSMSTVTVFPPTTPYSRMVRAVEMPANDIEVNLLPSLRLPPVPPLLPPAQSVGKIRIVANPPFHPPPQS